MEQPTAPDDRPGSRWRGRPPRDVALLLAGAAARGWRRGLGTAAVFAALVSIHLHRYEVITDPLTSTPYPARRAQ